MGIDEKNTVEDIRAEMNSIVAITDSRVIAAGLLALNVAGKTTVIGNIVGGVILITGVISDHVVNSVSDLNGQVVSNLHKE